jgi:hypothetical protein
MKDTRAPYVRNLDASQRPRVYWRGLDPEGNRTEWLFETVEDDGQRVAIRQMVVDASGVVHRYWWEHLEHEVGFLTDQPVD